MLRFNETTRARVVAAIRAGAPLEAAAQEAEVGERTLRRWLSRGRKDEADGNDTDYAAFAREVDAASKHERSEPLSQEDLIELLEEQARKGHLRAIQLLLERPWERQRRSKRDDDEDSPTSPPSGFEALDELAPRRTAAARR